MYPKPETYPVIYIIFTLLNAIRRGIERKHLWREFRRQRIALQPRLSFWIAVCREAGLVRELSGSELRVTSYARQWLNKSPEEQAFHLIEAWEKAPRNRKVRLFRRKLLWKLKYAKPLSQKDQGALHGLDALGLTQDGKLTKWGEFFIQGEGRLPAPKPAEPCKIHEELLVAPLPQHVDLLWDLEQFLRPKAPGVYPLTKRALQFYDGDPYVLIELLERGLGKPIPAHTKAIILKQPSIRVAQGIVLEFSSPAELKQLRRQPVFRKYLDEFLSPQRVLVSQANAEGLFQMLTRRGVYVHKKEEQACPDAQRADRRTEACKKRTHFREASKTQPLPIGKSVPKLTMIENYRKLGQALDILYRAPGYAAEHRRITPLMVEQRGEHTYIIAHCQTRRAQRTFRLDRMEIPGTY